MSGIPQGKEKTSAVDTPSATPEQSAAATLDKESATQAPKTPVEIRNPEGLVNAHERVKEEKRQLQAQFDELSTKLGTIEQTLGQIDATTAEQIKRQIAEAEKLKAEKEEQEQRLITQTIDKQKELYEPQIKQLEESNLKQFVFIICI